MASVSRPRKRRTARSGPDLTRQLIVETAIALVDERGLDALTMRAAGEKLGVEAMSLYRYVDSREGLLDAMAAQLVIPMQADHADGGPVEPWQGFLRQLAYAVRRVAVDHPRLFPLLATRSPDAPWIRPPLRTIRLAEEFLEGLVDRGFSGDRAVAAYRTFTGFLIGHLLLESAQANAPGGAADDSDEDRDDGVPRGPSFDPDAYPRVQQFQTLLTEDHADEEFAAALETTLGRIETHALA